MENTLSWQCHRECLKVDKKEYLEDDSSGWLHEKSLLSRKPTICGREGELAAGCDIVHCLCLFS